jgi:hypothetical protein
MAAEVWDGLLPPADQFWEIVFASGHGGGSQVLRIDSHAPTGRLLIGRGGNLR